MKCVAEVCVSLVPMPDGRGSLGKSITVPGPLSPFGVFHMLMYIFAVVYWKLEPILDCPGMLAFGSQE